MICNPKDSLNTSIMPILTLEATNEFKIEKLLGEMDFDNSTTAAEFLYKKIYNVIIGKPEFKKAIAAKVGVGYINDQGNPATKITTFNAPFVKFYQTNYKRRVDSDQEIVTDLLEQKKAFMDMVIPLADAVIQSKKQAIPVGQISADIINVQGEPEVFTESISDSDNTFLDLEANSKREGNRILRAEQISNVYFKDNKGIYIEKFMPRVKFNARKNAFGGISYNENISDLGVTEDISLDADEIVKNMVKDIDEANSFGILASNPDISTNKYIKEVRKALRFYVSTLIDSQAIKNLDGMNNKIQQMSAKELDTYMDYVFMNEIESVINAELPLITITPTALGNYKFELSNNIEHSEAMQNAMLGGEKKHADQNTDFIKFLIESTPNLVKVSSLDDKTIIEWFASSVDVVVEKEKGKHTVKYERDLANTIKKKLGVDYVQDRNNLFMTFNTYMGMTISDKIKLSGGNLEEIMRIIERDFEDVGLSFAASYISKKDTIYIDSNGNRVVMRSLDRSSNDLILKLDSNDKLTGKANSNYSQVLMAVFGDVYSHESRNEIKRGVVIKTNQLDVKGYMRNDLATSLLNTERDSLSNNLKGAVSIEKDNNGYYIEVKIENDQVVKIPINGVPNKVTDLMVDVKPELIEGDLKKALEALNFPLEILNDYNFKAVIDKNRHSVYSYENYVANYALMIMLNDRNITSSENNEWVRDLSITLPVETKEENAPLLYNVYETLWKLQDNIFELVTLKSGVNGDTQIKSGTDGSRATSSTLASNSNFDIILEERNKTKEENEGEVFFPNNAFDGTDKRLSYINKGIKNIAFFGGKEKAPGDMNEGEMIVQLVRDQFVPRITSSNNKRATFELLASERGLLTQHEIEFNNSVIPVKEGKIDFEQLENNYIGSKKKLITDINESFALKLEDVFDIGSSPIINGGLNYDFMNRNVKLLKKTIFQNKLSKIEALKLIEDIQRGILSSREAANRNGGNFMYFFSLFLNDINISFDYAKTLGLTHNTELTKNNGSWGILDYITYDYDLWNSKTNDMAFIYSEGSFVKTSKKRYDEDSSANNMVKKFVRKNANQYQRESLEKIKEGTGKDSFLKESAIKRLSNAIGAKVTQEDIMRAYYLILMDVNINFAPIMVGTNFQFLDKPKPYSEFEFNGEGNKRLSYISSTDTRQDKSQVKRNGLIESIGSRHVVSDRYFTTSKKEIHAVISDTEIPVSLLGTPGAKDNEIYDGQQFIEPLSMAERKNSFRLTFGMNFDGFIKDITFDRDHKYGGVYIEKTGTHALFMDDLKNDTSGYLNKVWGVPFRDAENKVLRVYVPAKDSKGNLLMNEPFITKNLEESNLTDPKEIYKSIGDINNMYDLFTYVGGFDNPNALNNMIDILSLKENAQIKGKKISVVTFASSTKAGSPVVNDADSFYSNDKPLFTTEINSQNNILILNKYEDTTKTHKVKIFSQSVNALLFGVDGEQNLDVLDSVDYIKMLNQDKADRDLKDLFNDVVIMSGENVSPLMQGFILDIELKVESGESLINSILMSFNEENQEEASDFVVKLLKENLKNKIQNSNNNDNVIELTYNEDIKLNGILGKVVSSMVRTENQKRTLDIEMNGINTVASNIKGMIQLYNYGGEIMSKSQFFNTVRRKKNVSLFTSMENDARILNISKIEEEIFDSFVAKGLIEENVDC